MKKPTSKEHLERHQPASRSRFGLLEKKKDYVKRARDFHAKEERLKALKVRAAFKNPDEYYFGMVNSKIALSGRHMPALPETLKVETAKLLKTQDLTYIVRQRILNEKKIAALKEEIIELPANQHVHFADSDSSDINNDESGKEEIKDIVLSASKAKKRELEARIERNAQFLIVERDLQGQRNRMGKGSYRKTGLDGNGFPIYKWETERKG